MEVTLYGTDHERYLGSGIVQLSQIAPYPHPDPFQHLSPECRTARNKLERRYRHEVCKPWLKNNHLHAEISKAMWDTRAKTSWRKCEEYEFPCLTFKEDATIYITSDIALLEIARSSTAWGLAQIFDPLESQERWWVVDFFCDDGSHCARASLNSQTKAVCSILGAAKPQSGATQLRSRAPDLEQAARLTRATDGMHDAMDLLLEKLPAMWRTKTHGYLTDIRKCWCIEEIINYFRVIVSQWQEITLQWHPAVVKAIDPNAISMLQSRAPGLSKLDNNDIAHAFTQGRIFPLLTDGTLREAVRVAVCRQGPILTVGTFAQDVRLLKSRVHDSLKSLVGRLKRQQDPETGHDTVRKRIKRLVKSELDALQCADTLSIVSTEQKQLLVSRCYEHIFLHTIRKALPRGSVSMIQVKNLVRRELGRFHGNNRHLRGFVPNDAEDDIRISAPTDLLLDDADTEDVNVLRRHGALLFSGSTATISLYGDRIHVRDPVGLPLSRSFMAKYVVRIFLFGTASDTYAGSLSLSSPMASLGPVNAMLESLPFRNMDTASVCTSDDRGSNSSLSSYAAIESDVDVASILWRRPYIQTVFENSEIGSIVSQPASAGSTTGSTAYRNRMQIPDSTLYTTQREDYDDVSHPAKRLRSHTFLPGQSTLSVYSVACRAPVPCSDALRRHSSPRSPSLGDYQQKCKRVDQWCGSLQAEWPSPRPGPPTAMTVPSPSVYSPDRRSLISQPMNTGGFCRFDDGEAYIDLMHRGNPFISEDSTHVRRLEAIEADPLQDLCQHEGHTQMELSASDGKIGDSLANAASVSKADTVSAMAGLRDPRQPIRPQPRYILYKSTLKNGMFYCAPGDLASTERFVRSQERLDPRSTFWYTINDNDKTVKKYVSSQHLHQAIDKYRLDIVFVDSDQLAAQNTIVVDHDKHRSS